MIHTFKVYPGLGLPAHHELYWDVELFPSFKSFNGHVWKKDPYASCSDSPANRTGRTLAIVTPSRSWDKEGSRLLPSLGWARFILPKLTTEIVAHESVHMATGFCRRARYSLRLSSQIDYHEECLAYAVGQCVAQLSTILHEHKLWPETH